MSASFGSAASGGAHPAASRAAVLRAALPAVLLAGLLAVLLAGLLTSCGDPAPDDQPEGDSTGTAGSPSSNPETAPADGPQVENAYVSINVPTGFTVGPEQAGLTPADEDGAGRSSITLAETPAFGTTDMGSAAQIVARNVATDRSPRILADTTLDGEPVFHLEGRLDGTYWFAGYGAIRDDTLIYVRFDLDKPAAESREIVDSVLATWQWK